MLLLLSLAVSGAGFWWAERQFEALGYAYSGAAPAPKATPFVFPKPPGRAAYLLPGALSRALKKSTIACCASRASGTLGW